MRFLAIVAVGDNSFSTTEDFLLASCTGTVASQIDLPNLEILSLGHKSFMGNELPSTIVRSLRDYVYEKHMNTLTLRSSVSFVGEP